MTSSKRPLTILNLSGELSSKLRDYFSLKGVMVFDPSMDIKNKDWTHIITRELIDFDQLNKSYAITKKDRHIISLTQMDDIRNFAANNGDLIIDESWFSGLMGSFILDKYFQGYGGISLGDNYPSFKELGTFHVTNPFNTGEYLDRMVHNAFENGVEGLILKTYFDHLIMYLASLKKIGKVGLPFEVTYGCHEGIFALQVHFYSKKLEISDITRSLSNALSKRGDEYFLNIALQSADFFDFSYMPEVNKIVITGLWTHDERIKFESRGLMFSTLKGDVTLVNYEDEGSTSILVSGDELKDQTEKMTISDNLKDEVSKTTVAGSKDFPDEAVLIKGGEELAELVQHVKGKFEEEDKSVTLVSGEKLNVDEVVHKISSAFDQSTSEQKLKVRSLGNQLAAPIKSGLYDFAKNLNKKPEDLTLIEVASFQTQEMPKVVKQVISSLDKETDEPQEMVVKSLKGLYTPSSESGQNALKKLEARLLEVNKENEKLKNDLKASTSEVRILKDSRNRLADMQMKAAQVGGELSVTKIDSDEAIRSHFKQKIEDQKNINEYDLKKMATLIERESKLVEDLRLEEIKTRKLQHEASQKEALFNQELEKVERINKSKDIMLLKTKEVLNKLVEKKDREIEDLNVKISQLNVVALEPSTNQTILIKDLENQNQSLNRQLEVYKTKFSQLANTVEAEKADDTTKDELRKLQLINKQITNQFEVAKKEIDKWQNKVKNDHSQLMALRKEKSDLELLLRKVTIENAREVKTEQNVINDEELKRLSAQNQIYETQLREASVKINNLEGKLVEAIKQQKVAAGTDDGAKAKLGHLEGNVKKLTQDLIESRRLLGEGKKETNKLRQDKTALQNQLDRAKKELDKLQKEVEKAKSALPNKQGGNAA